MFTLVRFNLLIGCCLQFSVDPIPLIALSCLIHHPPSLHHNFAECENYFYLSKCNFPKKTHIGSKLFDVALYRYGRLQCSKKYSFYFSIITAHILRHYVFGLFINLFFTFQNTTLNVIGINV